MALYAISDLHLPLGINKPMDIFGKQWENYVDRLCENWTASVKDGDTVVLPGDFSWGTYLKQTIPDFRFLENLPGKKYILKGNHDYWWTTEKKLTAFLEENSFKSIAFLQNKAVMYNNIALCGTRGWIFANTMPDEDVKIYNRELIRMELSLKEAVSLGAETIYAFMHYPPLNRGEGSAPMTALLNKYNVTKCMYGHLHAASHARAALGDIGGIEYMLVSGDYLQFKPLKISD